MSAKVLTFRETCLYRLLKIRLFANYHPPVLPALPSHPHQKNPLGHRTFPLREKPYRAFPRHCPFVRQGDFHVSSSLSLEDDEATSKPETTIPGLPERSEPISGGVFCANGQTASCLRCLKRCFPGIRQLLFLSNGIRISDRFCSYPRCFLRKRDKPPWRLSSRDVLRENIRNRGNAPVSHPTTSHIQDNAPAPQPRPFRPRPFLPFPFPYLKGRYPATFRNSYRTYHPLPPPHGIGDKVSSAPFSFRNADKTGRYRVLDSHSIGISASSSLFINCRKNITLGGNRALIFSKCHIKNINPYILMPLSHTLETLFHPPFSHRPFHISPCRLSKHTEFLSF